MSKNNKALGENPLSKGIYSRTEPVEKPQIQNQESRVLKEESRIKNLEKSQEFSFLDDSEREKVNFRLPSELNDWLDDLIKTGKRKHGHKIPKEIWVQAALELMKGLPVEWSDVTSVDELRVKLTSIAKRTNQGGQF